MELPDLGDKSVILRDMTANKITTIYNPTRATLKLCRMGRAYRILCAVWLALWATVFQAQAEGLPAELSEEARVSVLVASPSREAVYTYYGHAGLRVQDPRQGLDVTFNYGIFNFTDDFLFRFVAGQTDYMVIAQHSSDYMAEYLGRGSEVEEIILSLSPEEQKRIWDYLLHNIQLEHRLYRYQFFKDNCATRPLDIVDMAVGGLNYTVPKDTQAKTWRDEINDLEGASPWLVLGTDLALGAETDQVMSWRDRAFSPRYLSQILQSAKRSNGDAIVERTIRTVSEHRAEDKPQDEGSISYILFATSLLLWGLYYIYRIVLRRGTIPPVWDLLAFVPLTLGGLILFYISCLSEHQFVAPNYNMAIIHPLHGLLLVFIFLGLRGRGWAVYYHFCNFATVTVFMLVAYFLPQHFNVVLYMIAGLLCCISLSRIVEYRRSK